MCILDESFFTAIKILINHLLHFLSCHFSKYSICTHTTIAMYMMFSPLSQANTFLKSQHYCCSLSFPCHCFFHELLGRSSRPVRRYNKSHHNNALSPEKDQYNFCGRLVVAGPMGLSRHFTTNPRCSLDFAKQLKPACQQVLFPSMQAFTDPPGFLRIRTTSPVGRSDVSSDANDLCSFLSEEGTVMRISLIMKIFLLLMTNLLTLKLLTTPPAT